MRRFYAGRRVLVTGHSGFKGSWLTLWLRALGARVTGISLPPERGASPFRSLGLDGTMDSRFVDITDAARLRRAVSAARPEIVFHLAAQSLVRRSYREPERTFETNVMGTLHVARAAAAAGARVVLCATTDKCYDRPESGRAFVETDPLGGHDPYSASKACSEIIAASVRSSFLRGTRTSLSTLRAGNVIGGADWAEDRLLPDCVRAFAAGRPAVIRNPRSIRPWQHVLDPLAGYLWLAARQRRDPSLAGAWNFGPHPSAGDLTALGVARRAADRWGGEARVAVRPPKNAPPEAPVLRLDPGKAGRLLGWRTLHSPVEAVDMTIDWYRAAPRGGREGAAAALLQIDAHVSRARDLQVHWAAP